MDSSTMRGVRRGLVLLASGTIVANAAAAQQPAALPPGAIVQPLGQDDGAELRRHLTTLADNPRSLDALIGAGRAAVRSGDAEAALTFFARAEQVSPRDARVKAGMASAFVQLGRAPAALNLFAEAVALGAPVVEVAGDRGLAYDMMGDPRRAQQDYVLSLRRRADPEIQRRLALSLAISGEREAALRVIEAQLRRNDRAAWRTQALVLALTGDAAGATRTAQGTMPAGAAQAMAPFLARLPVLSPQQKAMAVHFGHFPNGGRPAATAQVDTSADPGAIALAWGGAPPPAQPQVQTADAAPAANRRRPGRNRNTSSAERRRASEARDSSDPYGLRGARQARRDRQPAQQRPVQVAQAAVPQAQQPQPQPQPQAAAPAPSRWAGAPQIGEAQRPPQVQAPPQSQPRPQAAPPPSITSTIEAQAAPAGAAPVPPPAADVSPPAADAPRAPAAIETTALPASNVPLQSTSVEPPPAQAVSEAAPGFALAEPASEPPSTAPAPEPPTSEPLADIESIVAALPEEPAPAPAREPAPERPEPRPQPAQQPVRTAARSPAPAAAAPARPRQPAHPSRHWVQIAGGANRAGLPREFARLREQAPELARQSAWTTPLNATNRLLVGPFASSREAQAFVNRLAERQVAAFAWTSPAGQEIFRLQTGR